MSAAAQVRAALLAWVGALLLLGALWVRSPWTGPGPMFLGWSVPAAIVFGGTWAWLGRLRVEQVPRSRRILLAIVLLWAIAAWLAGTGTGAEMILDASILRQPSVRRAGVAMEWFPGVFGLLLSVAGLAAALEARYRVRERGQR